jgi:hypothetical protein
MVVSARLWRSRAGGIAAWVALLGVFVALGLVPALIAGKADVISDSLYLGAVYRDLFVDHVGLAGWVVQPAPSFFPDAPVFFALRRVLGRADVTVAAYSVVSVAMLGLVVSDLARQAGVTRWGSRIAGVAVASGVALSALRERLFACVIHPSCHGASLIVGLSVLALVCRQLRSDRLRLGVLAGIVLLTAATGASDRIFFLVAGVPMACAIAFCAFFRVARVARCAQLLGALVLGMLLSRLDQPIARALAITIMKPPPRPLSEIDVSWLAIADGLKTVASYNWNPIVAPFVVGSLVATVLVTVVVAGEAVRGWARRRSLVRSSDGYAATRIVLAVTALLSIVGTFVGASLTHAFASVWELRYLEAVYVIPYVTVALSLALASSMRVRLLIVGLARLLTAGAFFDMRKVDRTAGGGEPWRQRLPLIACVDDAVEQSGVHLGYAHYFKARMISERAKNDVRLVAYDTNWIVNRSWYQLVASANRFLVVSDEAVGDRSIREHFGDPSQILKCPGTESVWIYDVPPRDPIRP